MERRAVQPTVGEDDAMPFGGPARQRDLDRARGLFVGGGGELEEAGGGAGGGGRNGGTTAIRSQRHRLRKSAQSASAFEAVFGLKRKRTNSGSVLGMCCCGVLMCEPCWKDWDKERRNVIDDCIEICGESERGHCYER